MGRQSLDDLVASEMSRACCFDGLAELKTPARLLSPRRVSGFAHSLISFPEIVVDAQEQRMLCLCREIVPRSL